MPSDPITDAVVATWRSQPASGFRVSQALIGEKLRGDGRRVLRDLLAGGAIVAILIVWFGFAFASDPDPIRRIGLVMLIAGLLYEAAQLLAHQQRVRVLRHAIERTAADSLSAARMYLQARYEFLTGAWLWSRGAALLPGVSIVAFGFARDPSKAEMSMAGLPVAWVPFGWLVMLTVTTLWQLSVARQYRRQLEELNGLDQ